jgi:quercetin dioxygenase-like cupin family protein
MNTKILKSASAIFLGITGVLVLLIGLSGCNPKKSLPDPLEAGWNNQPVCEVLQDNSKLRALKCTFPPGVGHERHYHKAHFGYTIAGSRFRIKDTTGVREVEVLTGSNFYNDEIAWHEVLNIGDSTAVFLIIEPK